MRKRFFLYSIAFLMLFLLLLSCMYVKNLSDDDESRGLDISLNLNRLNNSYSAGSDDRFKSVIDSPLYYIAAGDSASDLSGLTGGTNTTGNEDFVIAKINKADLSLVAINNLGGVGADNFEQVIDSGDYYIAIGNSDSNLTALTGGANTTGNEDFVIAKFNKSDLSLVHLNNLGGTSTDTLSSVIDSDPYYIAVGSSFSNLSGLTGGVNNGTNLLEFVIAKFNKADLSLVSVNNFGGTGVETLSSLIESDGYYICVGSSTSNLTSFTGGAAPAGAYDFVIARFNKADLSLDRINNFGGPQTDLLASVIDSAPYYIAVGTSSSDLSSLTGGTNTAGNLDFVIAKINKSDLSLVSVNNFGGTADESLYSFLEYRDSYIVTGGSSSNLSSLPDGKTNQGGSDFFIAKMDKYNLSLVSINNFGGSGSDMILELIQTGNYYVAVGFSESDLSGFSGGSTASGNEDFVIMKFGD